MKFRKYFNTIRCICIKKLNYINMDLYMKHYKKYLLHIGVNIVGGETAEIGYIDPSCQFDGAGYSLITLGEHTTISKEVLILVHDYSINRGLSLKKITGKYQFLKTVKIGNNCFIGARSTILPGKEIGDNCIIGSCSVIKGKIPENSIVVGNPAHIVKQLDKWTEEHIKRGDYMSV